MDVIKISYMGLQILSSERLAMQCVFKCEYVISESISNQQKFETVSNNITQQNKFFFGNVDVTFIFYLLIVMNNVISKCKNKT